MDTAATLRQTLTLERIEVNLFRGTSEQKAGRLFGGQVIAQALMAAYETVEERLCHSLHCYFIRPGDATVPVLFEVDRSRDGGTFTTRRVAAIQHGQQIFNFAASFQAPEEGLDFQTPMPKVDPPGKDTGDAGLKKINKIQGKKRHEETGPRPFEIRPVDGDLFFAEGKTTATNNVWMRATAEIGEEVRMQQAFMAYASDMTLLGTTLRPHDVDWTGWRLQMASLDHAMWFHRPFNFNDWHLYAQECLSTSAGRGLARAGVYSADGQLVASVTQEGLIRRHAVTPD